MGGATQDHDPLPMAADLEATKREGRRQLLVMGAIAVGILALLVVGWVAKNVFVPERDVTAARACREFEVQMGSYPLLSPDTSVITESAAEQTGKWTALGAAMTDTVATYDAVGPLGEDDAGLRRLAAATQRVLDACADVSPAARFVARNTG